MGVRGLWEVVAPVARPVKLEALATKRLAIDASIWIYQFLKAMRDSNGNVLKHAHIVGFFRRICKLLFFGIKPVFVFDGGAPALKRTTVSHRQQRRMFKEESAARTAAKLLTLQLHKHAASQKEKTVSKKKSVTTSDAPKTSGSDEIAYLDEVNLPKDKRTSSTSDNGKRLTKFDPYFLPDVDQEEVNKMLQRNDPRLMTAEELEDYANEFQAQISSGLYDTNKMDFTSAEFQALPMTTQYQMLSTARLRSRLRMGYTKEQLDKLFPDRLEFSRFQIDRVAQRNFFTQKLMNMVGMDEGIGSGGRRVAGAKESEYMLKKNENGWTLALEQGNRDGVVSIDVDETEVRPEDRIQHNADESEDDNEDWEDVPIEKKIDEKRQEGLQDQQLPEVLQGFESRILREQLYQKLKNKVSAANNEPLDDEGLYDTPKTSESGIVKLKKIPTAKPKASYFVIEDENNEPESNETTPANFAENTKQNDQLSQTKNLGTSTTTLTNFEDDDSGFGTSIFSKKQPSFQKEEANHSQEEQAPKKTAEVLPPWFMKENNKTVGENEKLQSEEIQTPKSSTAESANDSEVSSKLIPFEELQHERGNMAFYVSDDEKEKDGLVVIDGSSDDDSDLEEISIEPKAEKSSSQEPNLRNKVEEPPLENVVQDLSSPEPISTTTPQDLPEQTVVSVLKEQPDEPIVDTPLYSIEHEAELAEEEQKFADEEEEQLLELFEKEQEENKRFVLELNQTSVNDAPTKLKTVADYDMEIHLLRQQAKKEQRDSDEVTQVMVQECQELLRRFGIPYITAPMEAEAQCATLMELSLVDGIVTDDSDCFLFGGRRIFKNMFSQNKYVECYDAADLEREFGLDRSKYIKLAHLLGSDYTDGVTGIGPVTAMEILAEFDSEDGLDRFREWWNNVQLGRIQESDEAITEFKHKFKKSAATKIFLPDKFPDPAVSEAYLKPEVDSDSSAFEWGQPDLDSVRTFMNQMVGWTEDYTDQILVPVIRDMNHRVQEAKKKHQTSIGDFFLNTATGSGGSIGGVGNGGVNKSSRMKKAMDRLGQRHKRKQEQVDHLEDRSEGNMHQQQQQSTSTKGGRMTSGVKKRKTAKPKGN